MELHLYPGQFGAGLFDSDYTFRGISVTSPRLVRCYELEFYIENGGTTYLDGRAIPVREGVMICAKPGQTRYSELPLKTYYLKIREEEGDLCRMLAALPEVLTGVDTAGLSDRIRGILAAESAGDALLQTARILTLLAQVGSIAKGAAAMQSIPQHKNREAISAGLAYMEEHFREKCTLAEIAAAAHFSPVYFHGLFKKALGKSPYEYLTKLRIEEAKRLLFAARLDMTKVAERCGFSSQSYFNYVFRRETGETPSAYRRRMFERYFGEDGKFE